MSDRYAVFGNPIGHSKSPAIHTQFAQQTGQDMVYTAQCIDLQAFEQAVRDFFAQGGAGLNITVPFKERAYQMCEALSDRARLAGAVNTLYQHEGKLFGDNTDGVGLMRDITVNQALPLQEKNCVILGAGGAVRGILWPLLQQKPTRIVLANRTLEKAQQLADLFAAYGKIEACAYEDLQDLQADWVINGTSASLSGDLPPLPRGVLAQNGYAYDMMYAAQATPFEQWALAQGAARTINGLGMLIEQAAEAFTLWRGVRPQTLSIFDLLRA